MIKAVIFDLNGVFIKSRRLSDRVTEDFGISADEFMPALKSFLADAYLFENKTEYWTDFFQKWNIDFTKEQFYDYWFGAEKPDEEMIEIAKNLKNQGIKIYALSNNLEKRSEYYANNFQNLMEIFDKVYYSWQTGFVKPEEKAYKLILNENDLKPEECIYFDDSEKNVQVASSLGIKSILFKDINDIKNSISNI